MPVTSSATLSRQKEQTRSSRSRISFRLPAGLYSRCPSREPPHRAIGSKSCSMTLKSWRRNSRVWCVRQRVALPQSSLLEGANLITLVIQEGQSDVCAVDTIRLSYWRTYAVDEDTLTFTVPAKRRAFLDGFISPRSGWWTLPIQARPRKSPNAGVPGIGLCGPGGSFRKREANPCRLHRGDDQATCNPYRQPGFHMAQEHQPGRLGHPQSQGLHRKPRTVKSPP